MASRENFARTFGHNAAFNAVIGQARRLDTVGGEVAWRMFGLLVIVGAIWGLLTATRLLRKEEDAEQQRWPGERQAAGVMPGWTGFVVVLLLRSRSWGCCGGDARWCWCAEMVCRFERGG